MDEFGKYRKLLEMGNNGGEVLLIPQSTIIDDTSTAEEEALSNYNYNGTITSPTSTMAFLSTLFGADIVDDPSLPHPHSSSSSSDHVYKSSSSSSFSHLLAYNINSVSSPFLGDDLTDVSAAGTFVGSLSSIPSKLLLNNGLSSSHIANIPAGLSRTPLLDPLLPFCLGNDEVHRFPTTGTAATYHLDSEVDVRIQGHGHGASTGSSGARRTKTLADCEEDVIVGNGTFPFRTFPQMPTLSPAVGESAAAGETRLEEEGMEYLDSKNMMMMRSSHDLATGMVGGMMMKKMNDTTSRYGSRKVLQECADRASYDDDDDDDDEEEDGMATTTNNNKKKKKKRKNKNDKNGEEDGSSFGLKSAAPTAETKKDDGSSSGKAVVTKETCTSQLQSVISSNTNNTSTNQPPMMMITIQKPDDDGYNWRKYGQKQVKGCEFPRSYYKCTFLNCHVTKKVERSFDGHVTEIVYKGEHNHPKPARKSSAAGLLDARKSSPDSEDDDDDDHNHDENCPAAVDDYHDIDEPDEVIKRRKIENGDINSPLRTVREPRVVVQTTSDVDILDDGYRWRKYGQKVVKGNAHPRSYYKCTNVGCAVRKHVERSSKDPTAVITTYEGKHNHDVPPSSSSRNTTTCNNNNNNNSNTNNNTTSSHYLNNNNNVLHPGSFHHRDHGLLGNSIAMELGNWSTGSNRSHGGGDQYVSRRPPSDEI